MADDDFRQAYLREKQARKEAERLLEEKSRALYDNVLNLEGVVAELKSTQAQLFHSEKMASLGQLAAGVAHEINNPIGFSYSNLSTLKDYLQHFFTLDKVMMDAEDSADVISLYREKRQDIDADFIIEDTFELLTDTLEGLTRVKDIVANLKKMSYKGTEEMTSCDINEVIEDCLKVVGNELKYKMTIEQKLTTCPNILAQRAELSQVFINLFINASHACDNQGCLTIETAVQGGSVVVRISDNGKGMPPEVVSKIFDPFFTTKEIGQGTGLGLSVSHGIIEKHQGTISAQSEEGVGTTFTVVLPVNKTQ